jgi:hypothetical protein
MLHRWSQSGVHLWWKNLPNQFGPGIYFGLPRLRAKKSSRRCQP